MSDDDDEAVRAEDAYDGSSFSPDQRKRLLKMLEAQERAAAFWVHLGLFVKWIGIATTAVLAFKTLFGEHLKRLFIL